MDVNRWLAYEFENGKVAGNRVVVPAMASQTADQSGMATEKTVKHYKNLAQSGAGVIFAEYSFVHQSGKGEANQLGIDSDEKIPGLKAVAEAIKVEGALAGFQIVHAGGKTSSEVTGLPLMGVSPISVPVKGWAPHVPVEISNVEIKNYVQWYVEAATRAWVAGFDIVELHAAHGYGLNQWLSPLTNQRDDEFGGSLENRSRILIDIIQAIKSQLPMLLISVRIPAEDHIQGGLTISDMQSVVNRLEIAGTDLINVSSGIGGWRRPEGRVGEGYLVSDAAQIKSATSLPVIGVGGIESGLMIDEMLSEKKLDFAAVGRAILKDPVSWKNSQLYFKNLEAVI